MNTIFIGIAGGTGSGKTTLTEHLKQHFGDDISVVHHDSYYKYQDRPFEERCKQNYDHPDAFETDLMVEQLKELKAGKAIRCPVYSYADHQRTSETELIRPSKVVIVEGILIFQDPRLREMLDIKIFVETDADVRILRRALRDVRDRGRTLESVITQYLTTVKPMHEQFVEPSRKYADIIVLEGGHNLVALDMIMQRIASHINWNPFFRRRVRRKNTSRSARVAAAFRAARHKAERIFLKKEGRSFQLRPSFLNIFYTPAKWNTTPITAETPIKTIGCRSLVFLM